MNIQLCENGHHFDQSKYAQCPYCNPAFAEVNRTVPLDPSAGSFGSTFGNDAGGIGVTVPLQTASEVTVAIVPESESGKRYDPVVGWFVCVDGPDKGMDYRILNGNNSVGRGGAVQIRIQSDSSISKENMATVTYDALTKTFSFSAGDGRNLIRVNSAPLRPNQWCDLKAYDRILLGRTTLMFVPFCGGEFSWE